MASNPRAATSSSGRAGTAVKTGRAVVMVGKEFQIREYEVPEPAPGTLLLRQELSGICGTDLHNWEYQRLTGDILLGHENVGVVEKLGQGVEKDYLGQPIKPGDRLVFAPGATGGADVTIDIGEVKDPAERTRIVREQTPRNEGADVVFECAGFLGAITEGLGYLRRSGTYVEMGHFVDVGSLQVNPNHELMRRNLR